MKKDGQQMNQSQLIQSQFPLVSMYIKGYKHNHELYQQLQYEGMYGLCKAAIKFKPELGYAFCTLAGWEIRGAIIEYRRKEARRLKFISTATDVYAIDHEHSETPSTDSSDDRGE